MPFFRVLIEGTNVQMREAPSDQAITGFFATRCVAAPSIAKAEIEGITLGASAMAHPKLRKTCRALGFATHRLRVRPLLGLAMAKS